MYEDERRHKMCTGKTRYKDQAAADLAVRSSSWNHDGNRPALRGYHWEYCGRWHLTSQPTR